MRKIATWALITLWPLALVAGQNTVMMKDGTQFSGRYLRGTSRVIYFQDDSGEQHTLNVRDIQTISFAPGAAVYGNNNPQYNNPQYNGQQRGNPQYNNNGSTDPNSPNYNPNPRAGAYSNNPNDPNYRPQANQGPFTRNSQRSSEIYNSNNGRYSNSANGRYRTLPSNTEISVRTVETIDSKNAADGRTYAATIDRDVLDPNGTVVIPRGADAQLVVKDVSGGGVVGSSNLILDLQSVTLNGQRYLVNTEDLRESGNNNTGLGKNRRTGEIVGGGAALGTLLGAIGGGGKGALIGAIAGAAAGAGVQVLTRGREVRVPSETVLNFRLDQPMQLQPAN